MQKVIVDWLQQNRSKILDTYKDAEPLLAFFVDFFSDLAGAYSYLTLLESASSGHGASSTVSTYLLINDVDGGEEIKGAEFYFCGEFDGEVSIETYLSVLNIITHMYIEFYPDKRSDILQNMNNVHLFLGVGA